MLYRRLLALAALALVLVTLTSCGSSGSHGSKHAAASAQCSYPRSGTAARSVALPAAAPSTLPTAALLTTNRGAIGFSLDPQEAPCTVNSLTSLAKQGYFNNTPCHRLTTTGIYVLQCGDPTGSGTGGPGYSFDDELATSARPKDCTQTACVYPAGTVAMANSGANTNGSQFFLVYKDSPLPTYAYTIFGRLTPAGLKVVEQIAAHGAGNPDPYGNTPPNESVTIAKVSTR